MRSHTLSKVKITKQDEGGPELRRAQRFDTRQALWFEGQERRVSAEARNMSSTGMFVLSDHAHDVGSQLKVSFADPDAGEVSVQVEVVWKDTPVEGVQTKMGLKVISLDHGSDAFQHFVSRHLHPERDGK